MTFMDTPKSKIAFSILVFPIVESIVNVPRSLYLGGIFFAESLTHLLSTSF